MAKRDNGGNSNGEVRQCFERPGYSIDLICNGWAVIRIESLRKARNCFELCSIEVVQVGYVKQRNAKEKQCFEGP